jgi:hypothetical protein
MTETHSEPLVSNPWHTGLQHLRQRVVEHAAEINTALDDTAEKMGAGKTWTGPKATSFGAEAEGRKQRLRTLTQRLVDAVDAELRRTPERVPANEAKLMRMELQGY